MAKFPIILNGFTMSAGSRAAYGLWRHPSDHACRHADLDGWIEPARTPEGGGFDCRLIADVPGLLAVCDGEPDVSLARGVQSPAAVRCCGQPRATIPPGAKQPRRRNERIHLHWYLPTNGDSREIVGAGDDSHLRAVPSRRRFVLPRSNT